MHCRADDPRIAARASAYCRAAALGKPTRFVAEKGKFSVSRTVRTDMKAHESCSDPDGSANYTAVRDNVHLKGNKCKMEQQLPLKGMGLVRKSMIIDNLDKFRAGLPVTKIKKFYKDWIPQVGAPDNYTLSWGAELATYD